MQRIAYEAVQVSHREWPINDGELAVIVQIESSSGWLLPFPRAFLKALQEDQYLPRRANPTPSDRLLSDTSTQPKIVTWKASKTWIPAAKQAETPIDPNLRAPNRKGLPDCRSLEREAEERRECDQEKAEEGGQRRAKGTQERCCCNYAGEGKAREWASQVSQGVQKRRLAEGWDLNDLIKLTILSKETHIPIPYCRSCLFGVDNQSASSASLTRIGWECC